ncbi:MAG: sigma-70 family RNA polymerase sigma factor [Planctomycetota bacterium]
MTASSHPDAESLLAQADWIRELARRLVVDDAEADDVAQDAWVSALEHPPSGLRSPRAWLTRVVANAARQRARGGARSRAREERVARDEGLPSSAELMERMSLHRTVVDEVMDLREPYRSTVVLRFFDGLAPREIAQREGVPVTTVSSRITRALAELRERLDRRFDGDRSAWVAGLLPLARGAGGAAAASILGVALMNAKIWAAAAVAVVAGIWFVARGEGEAASPPDVGGTTAAETIDAPPGSSASDDLVAAVDDRPEERELVDEAPEPPVAADVATLIRGRVVDADGTGLPDASVWIERDRAIETDPAGAFELPMPERERAIGAALQGYTTVMAAYANPRRANMEALVVMAPRLTVSGRVVDAAGDTLAGASVRFVPGSEWRASLDLILDGSMQQVWFPRWSDDTFELAGVPQLRGARIRAAFEDWPTAEIELPSYSTDDLVIRMVPPAPKGDVIRGLVLDELGKPVADARVALGPLEAKSRGDGTFELERPKRGGASLVAAAAGRLPARLEDPAGPDAHECGWPAHVELQLGSPPLAIEGVVLDAQGQPIAQTEVWIDDPTYFGKVDEYLSFVEAVTQGERGDPRSGWTDDHGRFRIGGLERRDYVLGAFELSTMRVIHEHNVAAGRTNVVLRFDDDAPKTTITGRVVDASGVPVEGVLLSPSRILYRRRYPFRGIEPSTASFSGTDVTSDAAGRFAFESITPDIEAVHVGGETVLPERHDLPDGADRSALELVVQLRCHLRVDSVGPHTSATRFALYDGDGDLLNAFEFEARRARSIVRLPIVDGKSSVYAASDRCRAVALFDAEGRELARQGVELSGTGVNAIRVR